MKKMQIRIRKNQATKRWCSRQDTTVHRFSIQLRKKAELDETQIKDINLNGDIGKSTQCNNMLVKLFQKSIANSRYLKEKLREGKIIYLECPKSGKKSTSEPVGEERFISV